MTAGGTMSAGGSGTSTDGSMSTGGAMGAGGALARLIRSSTGRRVSGGEELCDLCASPLPTEHRHLYDTGREETLCGCGPCTLLFAKGGAADGQYRLIPQRRQRLPPVDTGPLGVPVGLAFFVVRAEGADAADGPGRTDGVTGADEADGAAWADGLAGTVTAHYPSPAGATRWNVDPAAWHETVAQCPDLAGLTPEVEALLVNTARGGRHHWIVPVDDCFRLVALVRREWRGLSGGGEVWPAVELFFDGLAQKT